MTLPNDVITALRAKHRDLGRAIVELVPAESTEEARAPAVAVHHTGRRAVIVVKPVDALRRLPGVELVSLGDPERALIALRSGLTVPAFELRVHDLLENERMDAGEADVVSQLAALLRETRRTPGLTLSEATIIVLEDANRPQSRGTARGTKRARGR